MKLTNETIQVTRQWFADNSQACIDEVMSGDIVLPSHVNKVDYFASCRVRAVEHLSGKWDHTFTFLQRAHFIQTGECVALLPA